MFFCQIKKSGGKYGFGARGGCFVNNKNVMKMTSINLEKKYSNML